MARKKFGLNKKNAPKKFVFITLFPPEPEPPKLRSPEPPKTGGSATLSPATLNFLQVMLSLLYKSLKS